MSALQRKIEHMGSQLAALADQQNSIAVSLRKHAEAINNQAALINHHQNAIHNIMNWIGNELGPEAVGRLRAHLGLPENPEEEQKNTEEVE